MQLFIGLTDLTIRHLTGKCSLHQSGSVLLQPPCVLRLKNMKRYQFAQPQWSPPNWQQIAKICSIFYVRSENDFRGKTSKDHKSTDTHTMEKLKQNCPLLSAARCLTLNLHFAFQIKKKKEKRKRLGKCWTLRAACLRGGHALQKKQTETERLVQYADIIERSPAGRRFGVTPSALGSERLHFLDLGGGAGGGALHL